MDIKAVIFDMDGVITDSESPYITYFPILCKKHDYEISTDDIKNTLGTSYEFSKNYYKNKYGCKFPYDELFTYFEELLIKNAYVGILQLKPKVIEILQFLKSKNIKIALASSNTSKAVYSYLDAFKIKEYFNVILTGNDIINSKPDPEIFLLAVKKLNIDSKNCIIVEDSINGLSAAKHANIASIMIPDLIPYTDKISKLVDYVFDNIYDITNLF